MKSVLRDPNLPHQIVLMFDKENVSNRRVRVSCNCLARRYPSGKPIGGQVGGVPMPGCPKDIAEAWAIYRDPDNHQLPF